MHIFSLVFDHPGSEGATCTKTTESDNNDAFDDIGDDNSENEGEDDGESTKHFGKNHHRHHHRDKDNGDGDDEEEGKDGEANIGVAHHFHHHMGHHSSDDTTTGGGEAEDNESGKDGHGRDQMIPLRCLEALKCRVNLLSISDLLRIHLGVVWKISLLS